MVLLRYWRTVELLLELDELLVVLPVLERPFAAELGRMLEVCARRGAAVGSDSAISRMARRVEVLMDRSG